MRSLPLKGVKMNDFHIVSTKLPDWALDDDPGDIRLIKITGRLNEDTGPELRKVLDDSLSLGIYKFVIDLKNVASINSAGLGVFIRLMSTLEEHQGHLVFLCPTQNVRTTFGLFEFTHFATITDDVNTALNELRPPYKAS